MLADKNCYILLLLLVFDKRLFEIKDHLDSRKKVPFSMAIARKGGTHARVFSQTLAHGTARMK